MWYLHQNQKIHAQPSTLIPPLNVVLGGGGGTIIPGGSVLETEDGNVLETEDGNAIKIEQ